MEQKPSIGRVVIYNHPGSLDGKYAPMQSPAIVQEVHGESDCDLFVMSKANGIFFAKEIAFKAEGVTGTSWEWPTRV